MSDKLHMFSAQATVGASAKGGLPVGQRHALLIFVRQPADAAHDSATAAALAEAGGWVDVSITKSATVVVGPDGQSDETLRDAMISAVENGHGIVVYAEPIA